MVRGMVLDIETRIDAGALRNTRRVVAPKGMPSGLQGIAAAAMLEFTVDEEGICDDFALTSMDRTATAERSIVALIERKLAALADDDGTLVTFNGAHDLGIVRLGAVRHHQFAYASASRWIRDRAYRHEDLMLELESGPHAWPRLDDLAAKFGIISNREVVMGKVVASAERMKCELDVVVTLALYMHILSERKRSPDPLQVGMTGLAAFISGRLAKAPHLQAAMRAPVFAAVAAR